MSWWTKYHGGPFTRAGVPDLLGCVLGRFVALEVKRPGHHATPVQLKRIAQLKAAGAISGVVRSFEDAVQLIEAGRAEEEKTKALTAAVKQAIETEVRKAKSTGASSTSKNVRGKGQARYPHRFGPKDSSD